MDAPVVALPGRSCRHRRDDPHQRLILRAEVLERCAHFLLGPGVDLVIVVGPEAVACGDRPETLDVVTLDRRLATAAQLEGFHIVGPVAGSR